MVDAAREVIIGDILNIVANMLRSQTNGRVPKEVRVYAQCFTQCCHVPLGELVAAKIFISRLQKRHPSLHATFAVDSMIRIFITAVILASKFLNDSVHPNSEWASASGRYSTADVNKMEIEFLTLVNYELFVSPPEHAAMLASYTTEEDVTPMAVSSGKSVSAKRSYPASSCGVESMDVDQAVAAIVDGPQTSSPDVYASA